MRVAVQTVGRVGEPYLSASEENALGMLLRPGFIEMGLRRSAIKRETLEAGEMRLCTRHMEKWFGSSDLQLLTVTISDAALTGACHAASGVVELRDEGKLQDAGACAGRDRECRENCGVSERAVVPGLHRAGPRCSAGRWLCGPTPIAADVSRRTGS